MRLANNENSLVEITKVTKTVTKSNVGRIVRFKVYRGLAAQLNDLTRAEGNVGLVYKESPRYGPLANQGKGGLLYLICNGIEPLTGYFPPETVNSILEWLDED